MYSSITFLKVLFLSAISCVPTVIWPWAGLCAQCQIISPVPFQMHVPACSTYWEADLCTTNFHLAAGMRQEENETVPLVPFTPFLQSLSWDGFIRVYSLFLHVPVTFLLAFSGLGVLTCKIFLIWSTIPSLMIPFTLILLLQMIPFLFFSNFPVWECQVFLSRYLTIHKTVCIVKIDLSFYSNNWRKVLCLRFYYIQAREKKIWQSHRNC